MILVLIFFSFSSKPFKLEKVMTESTLLHVDVEVNRILHSNFLR